MSTETQPRQQWAGKADFILSSLGVAVGLGNIWRFPYICFNNGGAVFLIPYVVMLVFVGVPLYYMELAIGQFSAKGAIETWKQSIPILKGLGFATVINTSLTVMYYMVLVAWTIFYIAASFTSLLPWTRCQLGYHQWSNDDCYSNSDNEYCMAQNESFNFYTQGMCMNATEDEIQGYQNITGRSSPSEQYFNNFMLQLSQNRYELGPLNWHLALCLLLAWIITYACLIKGTQSIGKVAYFTSLFPYVMLTILLIRGATLSGAKKGIEFYLIPEFSKLLNPQVWYDAAAQILYSLSCATGSVITFSSYNPFKNNCQKDAIFISVANCVTSVYAGFAIFSILGFMAEDLGVEVNDVAKEGVGLAFIAYPQSVTRMSVSPLWNFMFFFMLLLLGVGSLLGMVTVITAVIEDQWPQLVKKRWAVLAVICLTLYLMALPLVCESGIYLFTVLIQYTGNALVVCGIIEAMGLSYIYGYNRFSSDIKLMLGKAPNFFWKFTWVITTPLLTLGIMVYSWVLYKPLEYNKEPLPTWLNVLGMAVFAIILLPIPVFALIEVFTNKGSYRKLILPSDVWGPSESEPEIRKKYIMSDDRKYFNEPATVVSVKKVPTEDDTKF